MRCVILESPYKARSEKQLEMHLYYARLAMKDCLNRGEAPFASHLLYTQADILDDTLQEERAQGMSAGFAWGKFADSAVIYTDLGLTSGMEDAIELYGTLGISIYHRKVRNWDKLWSQRQ